MTSEVSIRAWSTEGAIAGIEGRLASLSDELASWRELGAATAVD